MTIGAIREPNPGGENSLSLDPHEFIAGSLALDFVDTIGNRAGEPVDRLDAPKDLEDWLTRAGLGVIAVPGLDQARELRGAIETLLTDLPGPMDPEAMDVVNQAAAGPDLAPQLPDGARVGSSIEAALSTISRDFIALLTGDLVQRIRRCEGCRMWMVDRSRPGQRRWCSSATRCGNGERLRRHRSPDKGES